MRVVDCSRGDGRDSAKMYISHLTRYSHSMSVNSVMRAMQNANKKRILSGDRDLKRLRFAQMDYVKNETRRRENPLR